MEQDRQSQETLSISAKDALGEVLREGARRMLAEAVRDEVDE